MENPSEADVVDCPEEGRYELRHGDEVVGFVDYELQDDGVMVIPHVEVVPALRGHGHSAPFLDRVLADVDSRGLTVVPLCGYAAAHIRDRPDLAHLLR